MPCRTRVRIVLIDTPLALLTTERGENVNALRTNHPKAPQLMVAGILRERLPALGIDPEIKIIDMKAVEPKGMDVYGTVQYGPVRLQKVRVGMSFDAVRDDIADSDIIGLTANFTQEAGVTRDFMKFAKSVSDATIIVGGSDAIARSEFYLRSGADIVVKGEGEIIGPRLVNALVKREDLRGISGIAFQNCESMVLNPALPEDTIDANEIMFPALDLVDLDQYNESHEGTLPPTVKLPLMYFESSRGCKQVCTFCTTPYLRKGYRYMSPDQVAHWLNYFKQFGLSTLMLSEDNLLSRLHFDGGRSEVLEFFQLMRENGFAWEFINGFEIGKLIGSDGELDYELIESMFSNDGGDPLVGCFRAYVPLESLRDDAPSRYKKLKPWDREKEIIRAITEAGIPAFGFGVIIGFPDDTEDTLSLTLRRCEELRKLCYKTNPNIVQYFQIFCNILLPGTGDFWKHSKRLAYDINEHPELFNFYTSIINGDRLDHQAFAQARRNMIAHLNEPQALMVWNKRGKYY